MKTYQVTRYICDDCGKSYDKSIDAQACHKYHQQQMPLPHIPFTHIENTYWSELAKVNHEHDDIKS